MVLDTACDTLCYVRVRNIYVRGVNWRLVQNWPQRGSWEF